MILILALGVNAWIVPAGLLVLAAVRTVLILRGRRLDRSGGGR